METWKGRITGNREEDTSSSTVKRNRDGLTTTVNFYLSGNMAGTGGKTGTNAQTGIDAAQGISSEDNGNKAHPIRTVIVSRV